MAFSDLLKKLSKLGQDTKNGVQKVSDSVTISNRIAQEKKSLERLFAMIGENVYKENPDTPKPGLEDEWAAVKVAYANIAAYTDQLNHVKGIIYCPNCGRPASKGDKFCAKCGYRLDLPSDTTGRKMATDIKEAGQEVGRMAGQAADRTGEMVGGAAAETKNAFSWLKEKLKWPKKKKPEDSAEAEKSASEEDVSAMTAEPAAEEAVAETAEAVTENVADEKAFSESEVARDTLLDEEEAAADDHEVSMMVEDGVEAVGSEAPDFETAGPESTEPETVEPEAVESEVTEPEVVASEATESEAAVPEAVESEVVASEATESESAAPEAAESETSTRTEE